MMRYSPLIPSVGLLLLASVSCKKSDKNNDSRTMANIAGSYTLTALTASLGSVSFNVYDTLQACEKDNQIVLSANGDAQFVDAGIVCTPPEDSTGTWRLSPKADTLYLGDQTGFIKSFDGKTIVLVSSEMAGPIAFSATTTLVKQ